MRGETPERASIHFRGITPQTVEEGIQTLNEFREEKKNPGDHPRPSNLTIQVEEWEEHLREYKRLLSKHPEDENNNERLRLISEIDKALSSAE